MRENSQSEVLSLVIERPGLYIGHGSVRRAKVFLDGYTFACAGETDSRYKNFSNWISNRFSISTTHDWASIISFIGGSEAASFELLKELWKEYTELA